MKRTLGLIIVSALLIISGCTGYDGSLRAARRNFLHGNYLSAAQILEDSFQSAGRNDLLFLLESGSSYHYASDYERSRIQLERADELARIRSCISVSQETAATIFDDRLKPYRCPDYERFTILLLLAINRFAMNDTEGALVELRRIFEYEDELGISKTNNWLSQPLAHNLAALCYLELSEADNAAVHIRKADELLGYNSAFSGYFSTGSMQKKPHNSSPKGYLLCMVENGLAPQRVPRRGYSAIPAMASVFSPAYSAAPLLSEQGNTYSPIGGMDFENLAFTWMKKMHGLFVAKEVGGIIARETIAHQVGKAFDDRDAEHLARFAMMVTHRPDLRSWRNLPQRFSAFIVPKGEGSHTFSLSGIPYSIPDDTFTVDIKAGKISTVVLNRR